MALQDIDVLSALILSLSLILHAGYWQSTRHHSRDGHRPGDGPNHCLCLLLGPDPGYPGHHPPHDSGRLAAGESPRRTCYQQQEGAGERRQGCGGLFREHLHNCRSGNRGYLSREVPWAHLETVSVCQWEKFDKSC